MKRCMAVVLSLFMLVAFTVTAAATTDLTIIMNVEQLDNGAINVTLTDNLEGTVSSWPVTLTIDGEEVLTLNTDHNGEALFDVEIPEDAETVTFTAIDGAFDDYTFKGCTVDLDGVQQPTQDGETDDPAQEPTDDGEDGDNTDDGDEPETTTTTEPDLTQTPQGGLIEPEDSLCISPRTTAVNGNLIGIGIDVDNGVLNASQNAAADYTTSARMWMDGEQYASLVSDVQSTLHLQLSLNPDAGNKQILIDAKNADQKYASYSDTDVKGYAMDLSVIYIDDIGRVPLELPDGIYTVEIPVPAVMNSCEKIAVAVCTESGLSSFVNVKPVGGVLTFTVQRLQTLAIVGFGEQGQAVSSLAQTPVLLIVLVAVGAALVLVAVLLLAFVVFRRKNAEKKAADPMENRDAAHLLIVPTAEEEIEKVDHERIEKEQAKAVLIDYDEQSALDSEEREQFRAKADIAGESLDILPETCVSPIEQISSKQLETIRRAAQEEKEWAEQAALTVDDILDMLDSDLEDLNS